VGNDSSDRAEALLLFLLFLLLFLLLFFLALPGVVVVVVVVVVVSAPVGVGAAKTNKVIVTSVAQRLFVPLLAITT
jgi:hypothetical protein